MRMPSLPRRGSAPVLLMFARRGWMRPAVSVVNLWMPCRGDSGGGSSRPPWVCQPVPVESPVLCRVARVVIYAISWRFAVDAGGRLEVERSACSRELCRAK